MAVGRRLATISRGTSREEEDNGDPSCNQRLRPGGARGASRCPSARARARVRRDQRSRRQRPARVSAPARLGVRALRRRDQPLRRRADRRRTRADDLPRARSRSGSRGGSSTSTSCSSARDGFGRREDAAKHLSAGAEQGRRLGTDEGSRRDGRARRQLRRGLRPGPPRRRSRMPRARPTASRRWRRCCTRASASGTA